MTKETGNRTVKRDYKSRMFSMIFADKKELLQLYNAMANRNYEDPEQLTINTLENAIYLSMQNDLSFIIELKVSLYEQQSTFNPNMPLRLLLYVSDIYSEWIKNQNIYSSKLINIPAPNFVVFYNGEKKRPEREILKLSNAYYTQEEDVALELKVDVININKGHNEDLLIACKTLGDYVEYVHRVRQYRKTMSVEEAVDNTIDECIRDGILKEFLEKNRAEARAVSIYEYDEKEHIRMEREDAFSDGEAQVKKLIQCLMDEGKMELIGRVINEPDFYQEMIKKYNLEVEIY